ncbi:MAG: dTDP-4-dehydrorhamnose 3,5-epimerase family protein [Caldimonas sp.]
MKFHPTPIAGVYEVEVSMRSDARGSLTRIYCADEFDAVMPGLRIVQVNHSVTRERGTVRGFHFQRAPALEAKLIRCLRGRVFDVAVDLREGSPTFAHWHAIELAPGTPRQLLIPPGCAHGFQALVDDCELLYQHSAPYTPECEGGVRHDDPALGVRWPLPVTGASPRDLGFGPIHAGFERVSS